MSQRVIKRFKDIFPDEQTFLELVVNPLADIVAYTDDKGEVKHPQWIDGEFSFYSQKYVYEILKNQYNERVVYHNDEEFIGYFKNIYLTYTPMFFGKLSIVLEDKIADLMQNANRGAKSTVTSKSDRSESTSPYNNQVQLGDTVDNVETNIYTLNTVNKNLIEQAAMLSQSKISGEVRKYVACYNELFARVSLSGIVNEIGYEEIKGMPGKDGKDGVDGKDGAQGQQGVQGIPGRDGRDGVNGTDGRNGSDGRSFNPKGTVDTVADLPAGAEIDDAYVDTSTEHLHVWNGTIWVDLGNIQGPQGVPGRDGRDGVDGQQGPQGVPGTSYDDTALKAEVAKVHDDLEAEIVLKADKTLSNVDDAAFKAKATAAGVGGGGGSWKTINQSTRDFTDDDIGKRVRMYAGNYHLTGVIKKAGYKAEQGYMVDEYHIGPSPQSSFDTIFVWMKWQGVASSYDSSYFYEGSAKLGIDSSKSNHFIDKFEIYE